MRTISLTGVGIAGAIADINRHFEEQIEKAKKPKQPDFPYTLDRTLEGQGELELAIEVTGYSEPNKHGAIDWRDPAADPGYVEFGTATDTATGKTITLTPDEWQQVEEAFWGN